MGATGTTERTARPGGPSRARGIVAAAVAILAVVLALILSRLDLANEVAVVRSQLTVANQELAENELEIDQLEDEVRERDVCRESAELGQQLVGALQVVDRGLERGDTGTLTRGVADLLQVKDEWTRANQDCLDATGEGG